VVALLKKTRIDGLQAELNSIDNLIKDSIKYNDYLGEIQYKARKEAIEEEIKVLSSSIREEANVAIYFGGSPVFGSKGIQVNFAGHILEEYQNLLSKVFAKHEYGNLGKRGKIPMKDISNLMVTEVARGSFGFILEEMNDQTEMFDTSLKTIVEETSEILFKSSIDDQGVFEEMLENLDNRTLISLKDFYTFLDDNSATFRLVEDDKEYVFDSLKIHLGRMRTESTSINEEEDRIFGELLGFLPLHKKFELKMENDEVIYGQVSKDALEKYNNFVRNGEVIINKKLDILTSKRTVTPLNREPRIIYNLIDFKVIVD
jgi:hypothetical protein